MKKASNGFTIIEILVTITIIGILTTIGIVSFSSIQSGSRNTQRSSKVTVIAEALEKYYSQNGEYPTCAAMTSGNVTTNVLVGIDPNALITPSGNSIVCNVPTSDTFGYVGGGGSYTLEYRDESTGSSVLLASRHTSAPLLMAPSSSPAITVTFSNPNVLATITPVSCNSGTPQYQINSRTNDGSWTGWTAWSTTTTATQTANDGVKYGYQAQARCYVDASNYSAAATGSESTYIDPIGTPTMTTVTANTAGATTTWSWPAVSCASGTTANYRYDYTVSPATYDSGWVANGTALSIQFTTSTQGQTYTVAVQAKCTSTYTASAWSGSGSASYYNPITYTLTTVAGSGGTVSSGGTYNSGATPTITATPNANYLFSSWSGSTGCSGSASHTITMDANKSCTANFVVVDPANWYSGVGGTALAGKYVYKTDLGTTYQYKTANTANTSPQGATGLDPNYPSNMSLVSPQINPAVDFSAYPAQNACKAIGGRLPNMQELLAIYAGRATYGNNFQVNDYWSSTEYSGGAYGVYFSGGATDYIGKQVYFYVRCVAG